MNLDLPFKLDFAPRDILVPDFDVLIEGVPVPPSVRQAIMAVSVSQRANQPASFQLQINDPRFELVDAAQGLLAEGMRVELAMGYAGNLLPMIEGEITSLGVELEESGGLTLSIEGFDALHAASRNSGYRQFREEQSDSAIVREIATDFVPLAVVEETGSRGNGRIQQGVSDLAYLQELAELHHFQLWVDGRTMFFMRERPAPPAVFARGGNLISFSAHFSTAGQVAEIEVRSWDSAKKEAIVASAAATDALDYQKALSPTGLAQIISGAIGLGSGRRKQIIHAQGEVNSIAEARDRANAEMAKLRRQLLTAGGSVVGDPKLRVGSIVALMDMGRFSLRPYVVESLTHQINASGYRTQFEMRTYP
jgi:uncharacterized protein